ATTRPQPNRCSGPRQRSTTSAEACRETTMTGYRINPNGVETVLNATKSEAEKFGTILKPLRGWVEFAATGTGGSGAIVPALQSFFENQSVGLEAIGTRVGAAITRGYQATKAYVESGR